MAFADDARQLLVRNCSAAALFLIAVVVAWWPLDLFIFHGTTDGARIFFWFRLGSVAVHLGVFLALRLSGWCRRHAFYVVLAAAVADSLGGGMAMGALGGLEKPYFHYSMIAVACTFLAPLPLGQRIAGTLVIGVLLVVGCAIAMPATLHHPLLSSTVSFLAFLMLMGVIFGHAVYLLLRRSYLQGRTIRHLNEGLEARVREQTDELRRLAMAIEKARESERARVARELHDELGQELTALRYSLALARQRFSKEPTSIRGNLEELEALLGRTSVTTRRLVTELRPRVLDDLGLAAATEWLVAQTRDRTGLDVKLAVALDGKDGEIGADVSVAAFRILQEALTNVARHAQAARVEVRLEAGGDRLTLAITDDGIGIPVEHRRGSGLVGMRERALALDGRLDVAPGPGESGTRVQVVLPLVAPAIVEAA